MNDSKKYRTPLLEVESQSDSAILAILKSRELILMIIFKSCAMACVGTGMSLLQLWDEIKDRIFVGLNR